MRDKILTGLLTGLIMLMAGFIVGNKQNGPVLKKVSNIEVSLNELVVLVSTSDVKHDTKLESYGERITRIENQLSMKDTRGNYTHFTAPDNTRTDTLNLLCLAE